MCDHEYDFKGATTPDQMGRRTITLQCTLCGVTQDMLSTRTDAEIAAELGQ